MKISPVLAWYGVAAVLLGVLAADRVLVRPAAQQTEEYHRRVRQAADALPVAFGDWLGLDCPVPEAAVTMLRPNVILSRQYRNMRSGESVVLLLVQVSDARDILGHYPPVCYPAQGWTKSAAVATEWPSAVGPIHGMSYVFNRDRIDAQMQLSIANYLFLPGGRTCPSMADIEAAAQSRLRKPFGAGQVQLAFGGELPPERQGRIVGEFVTQIASITNVPVPGAN